MQNRRVNMKSVIIFLVAIMLTLPMSSLVANAGQSSPKWTQNDVEALKQQVEELQRKIEAMEASQKQETRETGDKWYNNVTASIKKGKRDISWESADGNYKLRMRLRGQFLAEFEDPDNGNTSLGFRVRRARVTWDGHAFAPWFKYKFQLDFSKSASLKDMIFDFAYNKKFVPRVGQYKVPFNRETLNSSSELQLVDRSIVDEEFTFDRDIGVGLWGELNNMVIYQLGLFQGDGSNVNNDTRDANMLWAGRIQFSPIGHDLEVEPNFTDKPKLALGLAVAGIDAKTDSAGDLNDSNLGGAGPRIEELGSTDSQVVSWTADISFKHPLFNLEGEYIGRWVDPSEGALDSLYDQGFRAQGGIFIMPRKLELAARYAYINYDDAVGDIDSEWEVTPGINYYISNDHRWKINIDYSYIKEKVFSGDDTNDNRLRAQLQAYF